MFEVIGESIILIHVASLYVKSVNSCYYNDRLYILYTSLLNAHSVSRMKLACIIH